MLFCVWEPLFGESLGVLCLGLSFIKLFKLESEYFPNSISIPINMAKDPIDLQLSLCVSLSAQSLELNTTIFNNLQKSAAKTGSVRKHTRSQTDAATVALLGHLNKSPRVTEPSNKKQKTPTERPVVGKIQFESQIDGTNNNAT